jgi:hypothetical protein
VGSNGAGLLEGRLGAILIVLGLMKACFGGVVRPWLDANLQNKPSSDEYGWVYGGIAMLLAGIVLHFGKRRAESNLKE